MPSLTQLDINPTLPTDNSSPLPSFSLNELDGYSDVEPRLSDEQEDELLKVRLSGLDKGWILKFCRIPRGTFPIGFLALSDESFNYWKTFQMRIKTEMLEGRLKVGDPFVR